MKTFFYCYKKSGFWEHRKHKKQKHTPFPKQVFLYFLFTRTKNSFWKHKPNRPLVFHQFLDKFDMRNIPINKSAFKWVFRDFNEIIKMIAIIIKYISSRDDIFIVNNNEFLQVEIEADSKIVIDSYNKKNNIFSSITLLIKNI